ncbi:MAG: hypothetical protein RL264_2577 [Bacteroidota bacterium]
MKKTYDISVIIVNYNVEYFLEQCLYAVRKASTRLKTEVWVVDNNSSDGSEEMLKQLFPEVKTIFNKENVGFSRANNQAIRLSDSRYILLLNPDTVIEEDTLEKTVAFMDEHPDAGGLGVRMVDGKGNFLPESKRGLPTPMVSFYKMFGLSKVFPKSQRFGKYHLGYLSEFEVNEVDILSGAFMLMRSETLDKVGLLDETFFMYGEDIDLSYRIQLGGYKNYYFPETKIIHYKGESTKKSSVNYVFVFYKAMVIFARKHFASGYAGLFSFLIHVGIYFRAGISVLRRFFDQLIVPSIDILLVFVGLQALAHRWEIQDIHFPDYSGWMMLAYSSIWVFLSMFTGGYEKSENRLAIIRGTLLGTITILAIYALLPKSMQFSRLFILMGALLYVSTVLIRSIFFNLFKYNAITLPGVKRKKFAIIGNQLEFDRVSEILRATYLNVESIFWISSDITNEKSVGNIKQLEDILHLHQPDEIIFCSENLSANQIIDCMTSIKMEDIDFKIAPPSSNYIIGSNSIEKNGELYQLNFNAINQPEKLRSKRLFDVVSSLSIICFFVLIIWFYKNKKQFIFNIINVLTGKKTMVGYYQNLTAFNLNLPKIKKGIIPPFDLSGLDYGQINLFYSKYYNVFMDISALIKFWRRLDA